MKKCILLVLCVFTLQIQSQNKEDLISISFTENTLKEVFTLLENKYALKGNKDIYIQIISPEEEIVYQEGENHFKKDKILNYSKRSDIFYDNTSLDACVYVKPLKSNVIKGVYKINIYSGLYLIGNSSFILK